MGDIRHNSIAVVPIAMAPLARKSRPLLSMFGAKGFNLTFLISSVFDLNTGMTAADDDVT